MHIAATQLFRRHYFARGRFYQRRTGEKNGPLIFNNNRLIGHCRHIGAARRAGAHHCRNLRNIARRHIGLVKKDTTEMIAIREYLILAGKIGAAGIHQIDAG